MYYVTVLGFSQVPLTKEGMFLVYSGGEYLNGKKEVTRTIEVGPRGNESITHPLISVIYI